MAARGELDLEEGAPSTEERRFERVSIERKVGVAVDFSPYSKKALLWAVENVVRSGDHVVLVNVQPPANYEEGEMQLWETTGSRIHSLTILLGSAACPVNVVKNNEHEV
ncbi:hypothetical protein MRB53_031911 [Persea americana]|uniref:Uncharacterized protein n=1 Tax=Persea americana TaxID=3435 RepID=A0ACC2KQF2_PERAE|nr:hypothetical protein MRB53_031911 [Persea americana]